MTDVSRLTDVKLACEMQLLDICFTYVKERKGGELPVSLLLFTGAHLEYEQEQEVGVGHFLELLEKVDGQKGDGVVLGCHDAVTLEIYVYIKKHV